MACVLVYPLGVPLGYFYVLRRDRAELDPIIDGERARTRERMEAAQGQRVSNTKLRRSAMLWGPYEPEHYL